MTKALALVVLLASAAAANGFIPSSGFTLASSTNVTAGATPTYSVNAGTVTVAGLLHLGVVIVQNAASGTTVTAVCNSGTFVLSCGCSASAGYIAALYQASPTACTCTQSSSGSMTTFAECARLTQ